MRDKRRNPMSARHHQKWRTVVALILMYLAMLFNVQWLWGVLLLLWLVPDLKSGVTYFVEPLTRSDDTVLYWCVIFTWTIFCAYFLSTPFIDYSQWGG